MDGYPYCLVSILYVIRHVLCQPFGVEARESQINQNPTWQGDVKWREANERLSDMNHDFSMYMFYLVYTPSSCSEEFI